MRRIPLRVKKGLVSEHELAFRTALCGQHSSEQDSQTLVHEINKQWLVFLCGCSALNFTEFWKPQFRFRYKMSIRSKT